jgi:hypothetical protein
MSVTRSEMRKLINNLTLDNEILIKSSNCLFGIKKIKILDGEVIVFGGYASHFSIWNVDNEDEFHIRDIVEGIEQHISRYDTKIVGKVYTELGECEILK